jgi:ABC-type amino acid transport system permease subunit
VTLTKSTSCGAVIGLHEVLGRGVIIYSRYFNPVEVLLVVGVVYFLFCAGLSSAGRARRRPPAPPRAAKSSTDPGCPRPPDALR